MNNTDLPRRLGALRRYGKRPPWPQQRFLSAVLVCLLVLLLYGVARQLPDPSLPQEPADATPVAWQTFLNQLDTGNMRAVLIQGNTIIAALARSQDGRLCYVPPTLFSLSSSNLTSPTSSASACLISLHAPPQSSGLLLPLFLRHAVVVNAGSPPPTFATGLLLFCQLALLLVLVILVSNVLRKSRSPLPPPDQLSRMLKSQVQTRPTEHPPASAAIRAAHSPASTTTFADVAGIDEACAELAEVVQFLRSPQRFQRLGARIPRGILLAGPPGTGKTLLARAVAGEADVPFLHMSASEFIEMFVGVGASRVRDLFRRAHACAPCVVFLDEIDAVGRRRALLPLDTGERDQTLNQLLTELDGFQDRGTVVLLAATNRADMLDPALLRPGRFDRQVTISLPDVRGREAILRVHTRCTPLDARVRLEHLARRTAGMNGADLANLVFARGTVRRARKPERSYARVFRPGAGAHPAWRTASTGDR